VWARRRTQKAWHCPLMNPGRPTLLSYHDSFTESMNFFTEYRNMRNITESERTPTMWEIKYFKAEEDINQSPSESNYLSTQ
jgi:hypothetical protein